jgi:hypothetical protein
VSSPNGFEIRDGAHRRNQDAGRNAQLKLLASRAARPNSLCCSLWPLYEKLLKRSGGRDIDGYSIKLARYR